MLNKYLCGFVTGSIYQHCTFFENGYLFYLVFVVKNNAVQNHSKCKMVWFNSSYSV